MKEDFLKVKNLLVIVKHLNHTLHKFLSFILAHLHFPKEYPLRPPRMKFVTDLWHPNIEQNGINFY